MYTKQQFSSEPQVIVTDHAARRAQQRGVKRTSVVLTARYGDQIRSPGGTIRKTFTRKTLDHLRSFGYGNNLLESAMGTVLTIREELGELVVLTVRPTEKQGKRRGGVGKPKYRPCPVGQDAMEEVLIAA